MALTSKNWRSFLHSHIQPKMLRKKLLEDFLLFMLITNFALILEAKKIVVRQCSESPTSCGDIHNISYPFRLKDQPKNCGESNYELICENNKTFVYFQSVKYSVQAINRNNLSLRLVDSLVHKDNCSSLPLHSLVPFTFDRNKKKTTNQSFFFDYYTNFRIIFLSCEKPVSNSSLFIDTKPCVNGSVRANNYYSYVASRDVMISDLRESCSIDLMVMSVNPIGCGSNCSYKKIHDLIAYGFEVSWNVISCEKYCKGRGFCYLEDGGDVIYGCSEGCDFECIAKRILSFLGTGLLYLSIYILPSIIALRFVVGLLCLSCLLIYKWRRRHLSMYDSVEEFLRSQNNLRPINYSFAEIKSMTKGFKDKLGEGGYGSVYKGTLRSGSDVAVKILGKSKANGQEFINEVATIGRIHHVNVVRLIGFCAEGSKRALVYEFMPNGSLEKHIFSREGKISLSYEKMFEISLGVARGIEYLHRGCDMQILHFDIKPHNILLDEKFTPKVSDFGLAKLYPIDGSIVSLTAVRGTMGYIAPELFYKTIGNVSYKADVYSFGMLLLEMTGKRRTLNVNPENSSQTYFPSWIHDQINKGKGLKIEDVTEDETKLVRKMVMVGLWCIQMRPNDRPSMNSVIEMLQGEIESIEMPPKPSLYQEDVVTNSSSGVQDYTNPTNSSILSVNSTESTSLILNSI